jgi:imidazolonepropionase-like amidohydrolase
LRTANVGAVEIGWYGDLIVVRGNPLENMNLMTTVYVVIKGAWYSSCPSIEPS